MPAVRIFLLFAFAVTLCGQSASRTDINTAPMEALMALPGMTSALANRMILDSPFTRVEDLKRAGVSKELIEKWRPLVSFSNGKRTKPALEQPASQGAGSIAKTDDLLKGPLKLASAHGDRSQVSYDGPKILTNLDITGMVKAKVPDEKIVAAIRDAPKVLFDLKMPARMDLAGAGVSHKVQAAMLERTRRDSASKK
jgi:hypothetical protein